jgi:cytochrome c peroxidase
MNDLKPQPLKDRARHLAGMAVAAAVIITPAFGADLPEPAALRELALQVMSPIPDKMPGSEKDTPALIKLGEALYFEKELSVNRSQSCNTCHQVDRGLGGVDGEPTSPGAFGKRGGRNSPTTLNAGFQIAQFWDGRAADLVEQAKGPVLNPDEMAMPSEAIVVERLNALPRYRDMFLEAFPGSTDPINYHNVATAIAAYERTLITRDRFDDFLRGDDKALTELEQKGLHKFLTIGCTSCHNGPVIGGQSFQKVGLINPFPTDDLGRFEVTKEEGDEHKFKVPMLRNIEITGPYFHKGQITTLEDAVLKMGWHQLGQQLSDDTVKELVAFLRTLTDKARIQAPGSGKSIDSGSLGGGAASP